MSRCRIFSRELRILFLDVDVGRARETRQTLRDYGIPSVFRAETVEDVLGTLRASDFSAVVLDMPLDDEVAAAFLKGLCNPRRSPKIGLPVVLITSSPTAEELQLAVKMGINQFVGRPFPAKRLVARLNRWLDSQSRNRRLRTTLGQIDGAFPTASIPVRTAAARRIRIPSITAVATH
jgi:DNA-binding NtrC family response regulator